MWQNESSLKTEQERTEEKDQRDQSGKSQLFCSTAI